MKPEYTTKRERDWLRDNWSVGEPHFREWVAGSDHAHDIVARLDTHLEAALGALEATNTTGRCDQCEGAIGQSTDEAIGRYCACRRHRPCEHRVWRDCPVCAVLEPQE